MVQKESYKKLVNLVKKAGILESVSELLGWDQEVNMPPGASNIRAQEMGIIAELKHKATINPEIQKILIKAKKEKLSSREKANVREIEENYKRAKKVPKELVREFAEIAVRAMEIWRIAREKNKFSLFAPWLEKIIDLNIKLAKAISKKEDPFNTIFEEYENGITIPEVNKYFSEIKEKIIPLLKEINKKKNTISKNNLQLLKKKIPVEKQKKISKYVATLIGYDFKKGRIDESTHPFTACFGRITTRYTEGWETAILSTIHEAGHGMYEHNLSENDYGTPLGQARSYSVHESQSRFWENHVGRSKPFWKKILNKVKKEFDISITLDDMYKLINIAKPGYIRVEADELTYPLHIIIRFEIEQDLMNKRLKVKDLPKVWNQKMKKYLGIVPRNDSEGVLQDMHWASGGLGYFPTYALGSMISAQLYYKIKSEIKGFDKNVEKGNFKELHAWLKNKIHGKGCEFKTQELIKKATGEILDSKYYIQYLTEKFASLYGISFLFVPSEE